MANGIIVMDKPAGWTSHDVVAKLRRLLGEKRIGHAGTLDPMATGVLPVFVGRATRAVEFAADREKEYIAGLRLGVVTDTQDITGAVLHTAETAFSQEVLERALIPFRGEIFQIPPMYSAVKKGGKKLYELARAGKEVERAPRPVTIYELEILAQSSPSDFLLRIACSKGTYVRTICHDVGAALGCGGVLTSLRRTKAAGFDLTHTVTMEQAASSAESGTAETLLLPVDAYFSDYPSLTVNFQQEKQIRNGMPFPLADCKDGAYRVYGPGGGFLMLGRMEEGCMRTIKSFFEV